MSIQTIDRPTVAPAAATVLDEALLPSLPGSVMMMAGQLLLDALGRRLSIYAPGVRTDRADCYFAVTRGGKTTRRVFVPVVQRPYKATILSVLESSSTIFDPQWLMSGKAYKGTESLAHFNDSGRCRVMWPREKVAAYLARLSHTPFNEETNAKILGSYAERPRLHVDDQAFELPSIRVCNKAADALVGKPDIIVSDADMDELDPILAAGLRLVTKHNPARVGLLDAYILQRPTA